MELNIEKLTKSEKKETSESQDYEVSELEEACTQGLSDIQIRIIFQIYHMVQMEHNYCGVDDNSI